MCINFADNGNKNSKPVILIHGLGVNKDSWNLQIDPLISNGFRPIAIDVPGFGESPIGRGRWTIKRISDEITAWLEDYLKRPFHLVGISMGGVIAQQIILDHPHFIEKLVLVNTFAKLSPSSMNEIIYFIIRFLMVHTLGIKTQAKYVSNRIFPKADQYLLRNVMIDQINMANPRAYRAAMRSLAMFNSSKKLKKINNPTLLISGEKDSTIPLKRQITLASLIKNGKHKVIHNAGHAVSVESPDEFNKELINFLNQ